MNCQFPTSLSLDLHLNAIRCLYSFSKYETVSTVLAQLNFLHIPFVGDLEKYFHFKQFHHLLRMPLPMMILCSTLDLLSLYHMLFQQATPSLPPSLPVHLSPILVDIVLDDIIVNALLISGTKLCK